MRRFLPVVLLFVGAAAAQAQPKLWRPAPQERLLILAPHPDDESLGAGGLIQQARAAGAAVRVVFLTSGDRAVARPLPAYRRSIARWAARAGIETKDHNPGLYLGRRRMKEARAAASALGLASSDLVFLGYPDAYTLRIWLRGWAGPAPVQSKYTGAAAVPYEDALRFGAPYTGADLFRDVRRAITDFRPTTIVVSHPNDHNGDHRTLYYAARAAAWSVEGSSIAVATFLIHYPGWPPAGALPVWPEELSETAFVSLTPPEKDAKRVALVRHESQNVLTDPVLTSMIDDRERFGDAAATVVRPGESPVLPEPPTVAEPAHAHKRSEAERASFVPLRWARVAPGPILNAKIGCAFPLPPGVTLTWMVDGFRPDKDFTEMPKIRIECEGASCVATDRGQPLPPGTVTTAPEGVSLSLDWKVLGDPQRALMSAQTIFDDRPSAALGAVEVMRGRR